MTDAPLCVTASDDTKSWNKPYNIVNGYTDYGLQMASYRGELYGVMTQTVQYPNYLFTTKYKVSSGWKTWRSVPSKYRSAGRVSVTTLDDRFYVFYRGTNNGPYLIWTDDFSEWHDVGRIGSKYAETHASPAIAAYQGKLFMVGVGANQKVYLTIADGDGNRSQSWTEVSGIQTTSAVALAVLHGKLYLFHTGLNNQAFYIQQFDTSSGKFGGVTAVRHNITSGVIATATKYDNLIVSWRGKDEDIKYISYDGSNVGSKQYVPNVYMRYQVGIGTFGGAVVISYAAKKGTQSIGYRSPLLLDEKKLFSEKVSEVEEEEWDCKWDESKQPQKHWVRKMLCL